MHLCWLPHCAGRDHSQGRPGEASGRPLTLVSGRCNYIIHCISTAGSFLHKWIERHRKKPAGMPALAKENSAREVISRTLLTVIYCILVYRSLYCGCFLYRGYFFTAITFPTSLLMAACPPVRLPPCQTLPASFRADLPQPLS